MTRHSDMVAIFALREELAEALDNLGRAKTRWKRATTSANSGETIIAKCRTAVMGAQRAVDNLKIRLAAAELAA